VTPTAEIGVPVATLWTSPDAPREVDEPAVRDVPDVAAWTRALDDDAYLGLHGRTLSQLLLGEPVQVRSERDGWSEVVAPWQRSSSDEAGYPGWVRSAHLAAPVDRTDGATCYVETETHCVVDAVELPVSRGTGLWVAGEDATEVEVLLPGDRRGRLPRDAVRLSDKQEQPSYDAEAVLAAARRFLGVHYLWGGTSSWGVDCSGLVHLSWRSQGVLLPRDAHDQATASRVEPVPLDDVRPGDLYFFARPGQKPYHVGFVTRPLAEDGTRWMLHAPESGTPYVEDAPMAPHRLETLVSAGRVTG
jgi:cell wall-associated NlpC family hydrolase